MSEFEIYREMVFSLARKILQEREEEQKQFFRFDRFVEFRKKECRKMRDEFRKEFERNGRTACITIRKYHDGRKEYEIFYIKNGHNIRARSESIPKAKELFVQAC